MIKVVSFHDNFSLRSSVDDIVVQMDTQVGTMNDTVGIGIWINACGADDVSNIISTQIGSIHVTARSYGATDLCRRDEILLRCSR